MYKVKKPKKTTLRVNATTEGEHFHVRIQRIIQNKEVIDDGVPMIYTKRSEGVLPQYDIRTDRFDIAAQTTTALAKQEAAKRTSPIAPDTPEPGPGKGEKDGKPE